MKHLLKILGLVLLVAAGAIWYFHARSTDPITNAIRQQMAACKNQIILAEITDFQWDRVVILGPYTPAETANKVLGFTWNDYDRFEDALKSEGSDVIIFVKTGKVIKAFEHSRVAGDFTGNALNASLTPQQAVFEVVADSRGCNSNQLKLFRQAGGQ